MLWTTHRRCASTAAATAVLLIFVPALSARDRHDRDGDRHRGDRDAYERIDLVSDLPGALIQDPNLVNPWGIAFGPATPFWTANNGTGTSTLYTSAGLPSPQVARRELVVTIPPPEGGQPPSAPTGAVFNGTGQFELASGQPAVFIFSTEDGTIAGWNSNVNPTEAVRKVNPTDGAIYKGLAIGGNLSGPLLYATDFHNAKIDVFNTSFQPVTVPGGFVDPYLPAGYAPFGIQAFGNRLYVTYALQDDAKEDDVAGPGHGFLDVFDMDGNFRRRLISGGRLNSPWGMAMAPYTFGRFGGALLVGNFGNGRINAYEPFSGRFLGRIEGAHDSNLVVQGLWALKFGNGGAGGDPNVLYFTAGIPGPQGALEDHGLFGAIRPLKEHEHD